MSHCVPGETLFLRYSSANVLEYRPKRSFHLLQFSQGCFLGNGSLVPRIAGCTAWSAPVSPKHGTCRWGGSTGLAHTVSVHVRCIVRIWWQVVILMFQKTCYVLSIVSRLANSQPSCVCSVFSNLISLLTWMALLREATSSEKSSLEMS